MTEMPTTLTLSPATPETPMALMEVADERVRQVAKWGVQSKPDGTGVNAFDVDFAAMYRAIADRAAALGTLTWRDILNEEVAEAFAETDHTRLRTELVQVAAVSLAWVEDIDRKGGSEAASDRALAQLREALGATS